jgi:methylmalonyl-CoA mutase
MTQEGNHPLFRDFPGISTARWEEKIREDLKGVSYETLFRETDEGIRINPFYRSSDLEGKAYLDHAGSLKSLGSLGDAPNGWTLCQDIFLSGSPEESNAAILSALKGGAGAIRIRLHKTIYRGKEMLSTLFEKVPLDATGVLFQGYLGADLLYENLLEVAKGRGLDPFKMKGSLGADPLGKMVETGIPVASFAALAKMVRKAKKTTPDLRVVDINGALFQNAGSNLVEELAFSLAMANEYLAILTGQGIPASDAIGSMQLSLATGPAYFMEIAKLRAARILWARICKEYGLEPGASRIPIHATTSEWNLTIYDPYVNILRATTAAMSAILGGADLVTVLPYNHPYGYSNLFSDRIARNVQVILRDEAYFGRVTDPAAGSYYIENLTAEMAEKAWGLFLEAEARGGFRKAFEKGWIQEKVVQSRHKKADSIASGKVKLLGTNAYPLFDEMILDQVIPSRDAGIPGQALVPLQPFRMASIFEEVRLETERSGKRPVAFLFKSGNQEAANARATFSGNLFACAGYRILDPPVFASIHEGIRAAIESKADVIVLCSSDDNYRSIAPAVLETLKEPALIVVAGYPADSVEELKRAGIKYFIHSRSNLLDTLRQFNKLLQL